MPLNPLQFTAALAALAGPGLVREIAGRKRNRLFSYFPYLDVLQQGREPL